jgi:hypothetical protein
VKYADKQRDVRVKKITENNAHSGAYLEYGYN